MKTKLTILSMLLCLVVSCQHKPKNRIEERFERYTQENFYNPKDFQGFSKIVQTDTFDIIKMGYGCLGQSDSIDKLLNEAMNQLNTQLAKSSQRSIQMTKTDGVSAILKHMKRIDEYTLWSFRKNKLEKLLSNVDSANAVNRSYLLKARIKGKDEVVAYYAMDCAVIDTILISDAPISVNDAPDELVEIFKLINEFVEDNATRTKLLGEIIDITNKLQLYN